MDKSEITWLNKKPYIKANVVMLPTNEKASDFVKTTNRICIDLQLSILSDFLTIVSYPNKFRMKPQHLYIVSNDKIKKGDYFLADNRLTKNSPLNYSVEKCIEIENGWIYTESGQLDEGYNPDWSNKIIASTDESLGLPSPSNGFINKFIAEFNDNNIIENVLVEMERMYLRGGINKHLDFYELKISKNIITIRKEKNEWNREEVIEFAEKYARMVTEKSMLNGYKRIHNWKWIENNL